MAPNFASLLNKPADDVKRPVTLPDGTYFAVVKSHELGESAQKKTPYVRYHLEVTEADPDTDTEGVEIQGKKMRADFYITDESTYRLTDFIASCGVETAGRSLGEVIPQVIGQTVMIDVTRRPNERDPEQYFNEIRKITGLAQQDSDEDQGGNPTNALEEQAEIDAAQGRRVRRS